MYIKKTIRMSEMYLRFRKEGHAFHRPSCLSCMR